MRTYSKLFVQLDFSGTDTSGQGKLSLKDDAYERQLERAHLMCICVYDAGNDIRDRQLERECLLHVYKTNRVV